MAKIIYKADSKKDSFLKEKTFKITYEICEEECNNFLEYKIGDKLQDTFQLDDIKIILQNKMDIKDIDSFYFIVLKDSLGYYTSFFMFSKDEMITPLIQMLKGIKIDSVDINPYKYNPPGLPKEEMEYFCDMRKDYDGIVGTADMTFEVDLRQHIT